MQRRGGLGLEKNDGTNLAPQKIPPTPAPTWTYPHNQDRFHRKISHVPALFHHMDRTAHDDGYSTTAHTPTETKNAQNAQRAHLIKRSPHLAGSTHQAFRSPEAPGTISPPARPSSHRRGPLTEHGHAPWLHVAVHGIHPSRACRLLVVVRHRHRVANLAHVSVHVFVLVVVPLYLERALWRARRLDPLLEPEDELWIDVAAAAPEDRLRIDVSATPAVVPGPAASTSASASTAASPPPTSLFMPTAAASPAALSAAAVSSTAAATSSFA